MESPGSTRQDDGARSGPPVPASRTAITRPARAALIGWLGVMALLVAAGLAGRGLVRPAGDISAPPSTSPAPVETSLAPPRIHLTVPRPGSAWFGDGWLQVEARATTAGGLYRVSVTMSGFEIGGAEVPADTRGDVNATFPILPPIDGGSATLAIRDAAHDDVEATVDFELMPSRPLLVWDPKRFSAIEGDEIPITGATQPSIARVELTLRRPDGTVVLSTEGVPGDQPPVTATELTRDWRALDVVIRLPADHEPGCVVLESRAVGGAAIYTLETIFSLVGPDSTTRFCAFARAAEAEPFR